MDVPSIAEVEAAVGERFTVERFSARGGMGAVFLGRHRALGSAVAIKVLPLSAGGEASADDLARFKREAALAAKLSHPHIVPVFEFESKGDLAYLVMPFIEGQTLHEVLRLRPRLSYAEVREIVTQIGSALELAHRRGVIHRDIKPSNILCEADTSRWLLTDFGVARRAHAGETGITQTGMVIGTPGYMAPEQAAGARDVDGRADLYSLAAVACEALAGRRADVMSSASQAEQVLRVACPDVPRSVTRALTASLELERDRRPPTVAAWLEALGRAERKRYPARLGLVLLVVFGALAAMWWTAANRTSAAHAGPAVAILPFSIDGEIPGIELGTALARSLEDQLRWLPYYRVISTAAVERAVTRRFGTQPAPPDSILRLVTQAFAATEVVWGTGIVRPSGELSLEIRVHAGPEQRVVQWAGVSGSLDSLARLVSQLAADAFAERVAIERTGWSAALPRGLAAVHAYLDGDARFRRGAYGEAIRQFEEVIDRDSSFAPAYFKRMLCEVLRAQPTRATGAIRSALVQAGRFRAGLDPPTRELLAGYEILVRDGDVARALDAFQDVASRQPTAVDAWFILGYVQFAFGPLLGMPRAAAQWPLHRAYELDPNFAAVVGLLAQLAILRKADALAQEHLAEYVRIDSMSPWAELARMVDSMLYRGIKATAQVRLSFARRPPEALELIALAAGNLHTEPANRVIAHGAAEVLWRRAATPFELSTAFRLRMANLLGTGRVASADSLLREARRRNVAAWDIDAWTLLAAVTEMAQFADENRQAAAARRLLEDAEADPTALWLVGRWAPRHDRRLAAAATQRLRTLVNRETATPLARSLWDDLTALERLAAGDTAEALGIWERALRHYQIEEVVFGLVGSLWPLRLERARVAAASGDYDVVLATTATFEEMAGFVDQVAWPVVLRLGARALEATGDGLGARAMYELLGTLLRDANGPASAVRDSVAQRLPPRRS